MPKSSSIWSPPDPTTAMPEPPAPPYPRDALHAAVATIVLRPLAVGETSLVGHARKEGELRDLFARLSVMEARSLQRRLELASPRDPIVAVLNRLAPDRRTRLVAFLGDARRREALRSVRR